MKGNLGGEVHLRVETLSEDNSAIIDSLWASECMLGILNANRKIHKCTDTDVAFTREYSKVSIFQREREVH
jgi:hypothetical protein